MSRLRLRPVPSPYHLFNLKPLAEVKRKFEGKVVLFVCDFTPIEYQEYFRELMATLPHGT